MDNNIFKPVWRKEFEVFAKAVNIIILEGNVLDRFSYPEDGSILSLREYVGYLCDNIGYELICFYDTLNGFSCLDDTRNKTKLSEFENLTQVTDECCNRVPFTSLERNDINQESNASEVIERAICQTQKALAIVMDFSSRYIVSPDSMDRLEAESFLHLQKCGLSGSSAPGKGGKLLSNIIIMIVDKQNDLPTWFYLNNPAVHSISIGKPSYEERETFINSNKFQMFFSQDRWNEGMKYYDNHNEELEAIKKSFVLQTDGLMFMDLISISKICSSMDFNIKDIKRAVEIFKYGIIDQNPWTKISNKTLEELRFKLSKEILGQDHAIKQIMEVIERAAMGVSNYFDPNSSRPKGVLFFAGPTGTGKTQTAKIIAKTLFGSERSCRIFDMSEYRSENSDQRLLGAPPGYVGYEAGGQLTNAVRENPFSIFLFDEIEKSDPSILDKFLQILGDGRLTDGMGRTVYFTDSLIIFTSNLGIYQTDAFGNRKLVIDPSEEGNDYNQVKEKVTDAINSYFRLELQRAEILNRIGKNIVVFDFIRDAAANKIVEEKINKFIKILLETSGIYLTVKPAAIEKLKEIALCETMDGGRGIENMLEYSLINGVTSYIRKNGIAKSDRIEVRSVKFDGVAAALDIILIS